MDENIDKEKVRQKIFGDVLDLIDLETIITNSDLEPDEKGWAYEHLYIQVNILKGE